MKTCRQCRATKPLDSFYRDPKCADGRRTECAECTRSNNLANKVAKMRVSRGWFARMGHTNCLVPASKECSGLVEDLGEGEGLVLAIERVRSLSWHNMYFGCCREIGRNQDPQRDEHSIDYELRIRAGHFDKMIVDGHDVLVPKRIAFNKLSADQWAQLWPSLDLAMQEYFGFDFEAWKRHAA